MALRQCGGSKLEGYWLVNWTRQSGEREDHPGAATLPNRIIPAADCRGAALYPDARVDLGWAVLERHWRGSAILRGVGAILRCSFRNLVVARAWWVGAAGRSQRSSTADLG